MAKFVFESRGTLLVQMGLLNIYTEVRAKTKTIVKLILNVTNYKHDECRRVTNHIFTHNSA